MRRFIFTILGALIGWLVLGSVAAIAFGPVSYQAGLNKDTDFWITGAILCSCLVGGGIIGNKLGRDRASQPHVSSSIAHSAAAGWQPDPQPRKSLRIKARSTTVRAVEISLWVTCLALLPLDQFVVVTPSSLEDAHLGLWAPATQFGGQPEQVQIGLISMLVLGAALLGNLALKWRRSQSNKAVDVIAMLCALVAGTSFALSQSAIIAKFDSTGSIGPYYIQRWVPGWSGLALIIVLFAIPIVALLASLKISKSGGAALNGHTSQQPILPSMQGPDVVMQLTQLAHLRMQGQLTDTEFAAAKRSLLGGERGAIVQDFDPPNETLPLGGPSGAHEKRLWTEMSQSFRD